MMKTIGIACLISLIHFNASAWVSTPPPQKPYSFKFKMSSESYEYSTQASSYEDAYARAAQACFNHFKSGRRVSMDQGLDIIDICANPRSI